MNAHTGHFWVWSEQPGLENTCICRICGCQYNTVTKAFRSLGSQGATRDEVSCTGDRIAREATANWDRLCATCGRPWNEHGPGQKDGHPVPVSGE